MAVTARNDEKHEKCIEIKHRVECPKADNEQNRITGHSNAQKGISNQWDVVAMTCSRSLMNLNSRSISLQHDVLGGGTAVDEWIKGQSTTTPPTDCEKT